MSRHQEFSKIILLSIIEFRMTITQSLLSYGSLVHILTENNTKESKTSSQKGREIQILGRNMR